MSHPARRILVVEDEPVINGAVTDRLVAEGYDVVRAWDGPGAVAEFTAHSPELIVLDVMLPGFDGHEVCRRIQAVRPVPVLMLTARDDEADVLVGLGVGVLMARGIAYGVDRIVQRLSGAETIRDVIAFPKTASGFDLLTGAPAPVDDLQLRELGIGIHKTKLAGH